MENAVKHGLIPAGGGKIKIFVKEKSDETIITIENDGVGRDPNGTNGTAGTGKGLKVLDELYGLFSQLYKVKISQELIDLKDAEGKPRGLCVKIVMG